MSWKYTKYVCSVCVCVLFFHYFIKSSNNAVPTSPVAFQNESPAFLASTLRQAPHRTKTF